MTKQGKRQSSTSQTPDSSHTAWRIVGSKGQVLSSIQTASPSTHFLRPQASSLLKDQAKDVLLFGQIKAMIHYLGYSQQEIAEVLEVDPSTLSRWKKEDKPIGKLRSKAMYDLDHIIAKGIRLFGSEAPLSEWLHTANEALGDQKPIELLKDPYGMELVDNAMEALSWGNVL